jgi:nucleoside-diphosphate-sugar epimerase
MRALVIGGSGMFGRKTVLHMLQDKDFTSVVSMDVAPPTGWCLKQIEPYMDRFHFVRGDVSQLEDILNAIRLYPVDGIVNWAFVMREVNNQPRLAAKVNALGMCNAFEAGRLMGVNRVVYASSETVYGPQDKYGDREVTEDDQLYPSHSYAVCKRFAEILADEYSQIYGMKFTGVRPTIGYGHGGASPAQYWSDMPSFAAVGKPFSMEMDGTSLSSLVGADDLGIFTRLLIKAPSSPHPVYNVGGPPETAKHLAETVKKYVPDAKITFGTRTPPAGGRGGLPWKVSMARSKADFGFDCMPIEQAVLIHINDARLEAGLPPIKR